MTALLFCSIASSPLLSMVFELLPGGGGGDTDIVTFFVKVEESEEDDFKLGNDAF